MKLFVVGFPGDFDDVDLKEMFELYGTVNSAKVIMDKETGKSRGFGFIDMPDDTEARQAMDTLNGAGMKGKTLSVKEAEEQKRGGDRGGFDSRGGGRGGDNRGGGNRFGGGGGNRFGGGDGGRRY
jgi:cold-inducible RNA-binding protein